MTVEFLDPIDTAGLTLKDRKVLRDHVSSQVLTALAPRNERTDSTYV